MQVPHTFSADGTIHFGDTIQLAIDLGSTRHLLADNIFSVVSPGLIRISASSSLASEVRNTFVIEKVPSTRAASAAMGATMGLSRKDDILRFGDKVYLASNPALTVDPTSKIVGMQYLLQSQRANNVLGSGRKGRQDCTMSTKRSADAEWVVATPTFDRLVADGTPVHAGADIVLLHAMSNQALAAVEGETIPTDFGVELDVHVQSYRRTAHSSMGHTGELPLQAAQPCNIWKIVTAAHPEEAEDTRGFRGLTAESLIERAGTMIGDACGIHGLRSLSLALAALDQRGNGLIPKDATRYALFDHGVLQSEDEFALLLAPFDVRGFIRPNELLAALRGDNYTSGRQSYVREAYTAVLASKDARLLAKAAAIPPLKSGAGTNVIKTATTPSSIRGSVSVSELKALFDAKFDIRVRLHGSMSAVEAAAEFERQWPNHGKPGDAVTEDDFLTYYHDVSAAIPDDFDFVEMVCNVWHVPGRGNWKAKKSKKVLVTFHKGSSTEVVIPECEDIPDDDFEGLTIALKAMGFGGIARVKVLAIFDPEA